MKKFEAKYLAISFLITASIFVLLCSSAIAAVTVQSSQDLQLAARTTERKNTQKLQLTTSQTQSIIKKCVAAQNKIKSIAAKDKAAAEKRQDVYSDLSTHLSSIVNSSRDLNIDTSLVAAAQTKFNNAVNQYLDDADAYQIALDDLVKLECTSDPAGFQATLVSARQLRAELAKDAAEIKTVRQEVIQSLDKLNDRLGGMPNSEGAGE